MNSDFGAAIAVLVIFGGPIAYFIANRVFTHQERMEMLRRGMVPPLGPKDRPRNFEAQFGAVPPPQQNVPPQAYYDPQAQATLRKGISIAFIGAAIFIGLSLGLGTGPWILGGLIPMFVGIAQIIIAVMSGAQFAPFGRQQTFNPPPSPPPHDTQSPFGSAQSSGPQPSGPPYGWRPPSGVTELEKPPQPPERT